MLRTRRRLLQAATTWPAFRALQAARKEFWESKEPADWSNEEKRILLGQSPWAREGIVRFDVERKRGGPTGTYEGVARAGGGVPGANPGAPPGAPTSVPIGERPPPVPSTDTGQSVQFRVLARWESAMPVRLAGGPEMPEETARFYAIRLQGMPLLPPPKGSNGERVSNPNEGMLEAIKQGSRIERGGKIAIPCAHLLTGSGDSATEVLLFFARGANPITVGEKAVTLESRFGPFHLSIKFPLKEMMYKGALALWLRRSCGGRSRLRASDQFSIGIRSTWSITSISTGSWRGSSLNPSESRIAVKTVAVGAAGRSVLASADAARVASAKGDGRSSTGSGAQERSMSYVPLSPVKSCTGRSRLFARKRASVAMVMEPLNPRMSGAARKNIKPGRGPMRRKHKSASLNFGPPFPTTSAYTGLGRSSLWAASLNLSTSNA